MSATPSLRFWLLAFGAGMVIASGLFGWLGGAQMAEILAKKTPPPQVECVCRQVAP